MIFCVAGTLVNVAGFMHFWGLTIGRRGLIIGRSGLIICVGGSLKVGGLIKGRRAHYW